MCWRPFHQSRSLAWSHDVHKWWMRSVTRTPKQHPKFIFDVIGAGRLRCWMSIPCNGIYQTQFSVEQVHEIGIAHRKWRTIYHGLMRCFAFTFLSLFLCLPLFWFVRIECILIVFHSGPAWPGRRDIDFQMNIKLIKSKFIWARVRALAHTLTNSNSVRSIIWILRGGGGGGGRRTECFRRNRKIA